MRKIISFSLWGNNRKYLNGAIENCKLAQTIYPDWISYYYLDSIAEEILPELLKFDNVKNELSKMYPEVKFIIYDTSEGGYNKIHIEANKEESDEEVMLESLIKRTILKIKSK